MLAKTTLRMPLLRDELLDVLQGAIRYRVERYRKFKCGLTGHDYLMDFENNRMSMKCISCGHNTPGWDLSGNGPVKRLQ